MARYIRSHARAANSIPAPNEPLSCRSVTPEPPPISGPSEEAVEYESHPHHQIEQSERADMCVADDETCYEYRSVYVRSPGDRDFEFGGVVR